MAAIVQPLHVAPSGIVISEEVWVTKCRKIFVKVSGLAMTGGIVSRHGVDDESLVAALL